VLGEFFAPAPYTVQCHSGEPALRIYTEIEGKQVELDDKYSDSTEIYNKNTRV